MLPYRDSRITKIVLAVFFVAIVAYAYYEGRGMIYGPQIHVSSEIHEVHDPFIVLSGRADRIAKLSINGLPIAVTENGSFEEPYLLSPGLNRIVLDAEDRYGRKDQKVVEIVYTPDETASSLAPGTTDGGTTTESVAP